MSIYPDYFSVYQRLKSTTLNSFTSQINSHIHNSIFGQKVSFTNLSGYIVASQIRDGIITGAMIASNSISSSHIVDGTIVLGDMNMSTIKFDSNSGYAYYKP